MSSMSCPTARALFEDYSRATIELFEATDNLSVLVGRHEEFAEAKKHTDQMHAKMPRYPSNSRTTLEGARMSGIRHRINGGNPDLTRFGLLGVALPSQFK